jgi:cytochrome c5
MKWLVVMFMVLLLTACGGEGDAAGGAAGTPPHPGEQTYNRYCFSCHAAGIAGAPRTGDAEAWAPRIAQGEDALLQATITGIPPGMPARGLCQQCSDEQLAEAIDFMVVRSRAASPEPTAR